jgi:hypothetical protein
MAGWVPPTLAVSSLLFMPPTSFGEWPVNSVKNWEDIWLNLELTGNQPPELSLVKTWGKYFNQLPKSPRPSCHYIVLITFSVY